MFDEITSGFRVVTGGTHLTLGVQPDLVTLGKTMSNGFAMTAVVGRREVMEAAHRTFISSAFFTERVGPAAALAAVETHRRIEAGATLVAIGRRVQEGWRRAAERATLPVIVSGIPPLASFSFDDPEAPALTTLFMQELLERGFLASGRFYPTVRREESHVAAYLTAVEAAFANIAQARTRRRPQAARRTREAHGLRPVGLRAWPGRSGRRQAIPRAFPASRRPSCSR